MRVCVSVIFETSNRRVVICCTNTQPTHTKPPTIGFTGCKTALFKELVDYANELLFFRGFSLEMITEEQMAKTMTQRPVLMRPPPLTPIELAHAPHLPRHLPDPIRGTGVTVYMPRTSKDDAYVEIATKIVSKVDGEEQDKYFVECFKALPIGVMPKKRITKECAPKAVIIAAEGARFHPGEEVIVYMPYFTIKGTVTQVDASGSRKKYDVLYNFAQSKNAGRTRFFGKAVELWKQIPPEYEYPEAEGQALLPESGPLPSESGDATFIGRRNKEGVEEKWKNFPPETDKTVEIRKQLEEKSVSLPYLCKMLSEHGVTDEKIPLYAWQVFPNGHNAVDYMAELIKKERAPLEVVAAYVGVLAKIKATEQEELKDQLENAFYENDLITARELLVKIGQPDNEQLKLHIYDVLSGKKWRRKRTVFAEEKEPEKQKVNYAVIGKLLDLVDHTSNADKLKEEQAKRKPDKARVQNLQDKVNQDKVQLELRQKPFQQWLEAFATLLDGDGEYGQLGAWADRFVQVENERKNRHGRLVDKLQTLKSRADSIMADVSTTTLAKLEQGAAEMMSSFEAPISLDAALYKRIFGLLFSISLSFFIVLAYDIFHGGEFTLTVFIAVQASIFGIFYKKTTIEQFEKGSLNDALAYHINCFRTVYDGDFQANGRLCCDRYWCCVALGCGSPRGDVKIGYHKWRAMALHKMIRDKKMKH